MTFEEFFTRATGHAPYPYQVELAQASPWPHLLEAPTGAGKTEAIVLAWLWRRWHGPAAVRTTTPRRLVYTLPMRVLVEQTEARVTRWLKALNLTNTVGVHVLMGGATDNAWELFPERTAVLIGTQDMLLSRALNRGYALSRAHWPMPFGLLNNDSLWVLDEVQLMGSGLATTAQLAAFRQTFGVWGHCPTLWVSATLRPDWLNTVDFRATVSAGLTTHRLSDAAWHDAHSPLTRRLHAPKAVRAATSQADDPKKLAKEILDAHQAGTLTLVVLNTVKKAVAVYTALKDLLEPPKKKAAKAASLPWLTPSELLLLHSRFRPPDRQANLQRLAHLQTSGGIVVSTQVVEAGVDLSARALFTEISPWASFIQRVGRCNRAGEFDRALVYWVDTKKPQPYTAEDLAATRAELSRLTEASPLALRQHMAGLPEATRQQLYPYAPGSVIRRKDVAQLFDTTADLTGADVDIARFIRETDDHDVQVFWRTWDEADPNLPEPQPEPSRDELCAAPVGEVRDLVKNKKQAVYRWDFLESRWQRADRVVPGQVYLLAANAGGYTAELGWSAEATDPVPAVTPASPPSPADGNDRDRLSYGQKIWQTIAAHTNQVVEELEAMLAELGEVLSEAERASLRQAARWHDWGKAHPVFQNALTTTKHAVPDLPAGHGWGKSAAYSTRYARPGFRHELASALGALALGHPDEVCYLIAAHHGKVRVSLRSLPTENPASNGQRFARGVWEGDTLPPVKLGGGVTAPSVTLSLAPMELGLTNGQPSWADRVLTVLEHRGPYRLAYLETLLCAADRRASAHARPEVSND